MPRILPALLILLLTGPVRAVTVEQGELEGAPFALARPDGDWNGSLLILAPGLRPLAAPRTPELNPDQPAYRSLLNNGWMVATTSYRRNGVVIADALTDLDNLVAHVTKAHGQPKRVLVEGESMGGTIALLLAEREADLYHGVIAVSPAPQLREPDRSSGFNLRPQIPVIFLANQGELEAFRSYIENVNDDLLGVVRPVLFRISRNGHANINAQERLVGLHALNNWLDHGRQALPPEVRNEVTTTRFNVRPSTGSAILGRALPDSAIHDATRPPPAAPSEVIMDPDGHGFAATVVGVSIIHGHLLLNAQPADFDVIGLSPGAYFQARTADGRIMRVLYARDFERIPRGQWLALPGADGFFQLSRHQTGAASDGLLAVGDAVHIRRYDP